MGVGQGQGAIGSSLFHDFQSSLVWEFEPLWDFVFFHKFCEICKIHEFGIPLSLLRG